uniref:Protein kinase domain-containing protein n=1 Tax=Plectus sambesii TaxID=2011161 RepID=A0A914WVU1_9BILA
MESPHTPTKMVVMRTTSPRSMANVMPEVRSQMSEPALDDGDEELWEGCSARSPTEFTGKEHFAVGYTQMTRAPSFSSLRLTPNAAPQSSSSTLPPTPKNAVSMPLPTAKNPDSPFARSWPNCSNGRRRSSGNISRDILLSTLQLQSPLNGQTPQSAKNYRAKGVLTVDQRTTEILIANDLACKIFGLGHRKLIGKKLSELCPHDSKIFPAITDRCMFDENDELQPVFGKAVEIVDANGKQDTVCLWSYPLTSTHDNLGLVTASSKNTRLLTGNGQQRPASESFADLGFRKTSVPSGPVLDTRRWLILMEPVDAMSVWCTLGAKGRIFRADDAMAELLDYECMSELLGTKLEKLIQSVELDSGDHEQHVCALGARGNYIPIMVNVYADRDADTTVSTVVPAHLGFLFSLIGVDSAERMFKNGPITDILPNIYDDIRNTSLGDQPDKDSLSFNNASTPQSQINNRTKLTSQVLDTLASLSLLETIDSESSNHSSDEDEFNGGAASTSTPQSLEAGGRRNMSTPIKNKNNNVSESQCAVDACQLPKPLDNFKEGAYYGLAKHKDGSSIAVRFDIRRLELKGGQVLWAMWICYDRTSDLGLACCPPSPSLVEDQESQDSNDGIILGDFSQFLIGVLDVFENDTYYQLVMEKLGCGMDLFEFIDRQPKIDESLASHIFRQIVSAVSYLHRNGIVHRDLKDENVIIDQSFCCKLIDFGSAARFGGDVLFSTFCGTMEYCSPEVLTGNKYAGPELEMWSLGILLYTLIFFENPFRTAQETVRADLEMPWEVSEGLFQVISWLLQPDPRSRATVRDIQSHWWTMQPVDASKYRLHDVIKNCDTAEIDPPVYLKDLAKRYVTSDDSAAENNLSCP